MKKRLDAATTAGIEAWNRVESERPVSASYVASYVDFTRAALAASDAVMFSDESIERVAVALWNHDFPSHPINGVSELLEWTRGRRLEQARIVVAALKGEQP